MRQSGEPRLLYVAFPFPPSRGAGVYRVVATVNHLISTGWRVTVIAPEEDYFRRIQGSEDRSLMSWVDTSADVIRVPLVNWMGETQLRNMPLARVVSPRRFRQSAMRAQRYMSPLDHYPFWLVPALGAARKAGRRAPIDLVLATGNPFNSFVVAALLARQRKIPYVLDYRDAWTFDQFTGDIKPLASEVALPLERRLLHGSAAFLSVNSAILDWLSAHHAIPDRVQRQVIPNGYDEKFVTSTQSSPRADGNFKYAHVGTLVPGKLNWHELIRLFDQTAGQIDAKVTLDMYGHLGFSLRQQKDLEHLFQSSPTIKYHGPIAREKVNTIYADADVLYLPLYDSPYVTSGKVYEMMATRKPILAWGSDAAGALEPLKGYPKLVRADPRRPSTLVRAISAANALSRFVSSELEASTAEYVARYSRAKSLELLDPLLRDLLRSRG